MPKPERLRRTRELLGMMQLDGVEHLRPAALSGGMRQRVGLARALAVDLSCILMDEPFNALDQETKSSVRNYFQRAIKHSGLRAVLVTHDIQEAILLGDMVVVLRGPNDIAVRDLLSGADDRGGEAAGRRRDTRYWVDRIGGLISTRERVRRRQ